MGIYEVRHKDLVSYHQAAIKLARRFDGFYIDYVLHLENMYVGTLIALVAILVLSDQTSQCIFISGRDLYCL